MRLLANCLETYNSAFRGGGGGGGLYLLTMLRNIEILQKNNLFCVILGGGKILEILGG